jgi:hypothetical protein
MARGGHALPKVSLGPAMPYLSTPFMPAGQAACGHLLPPWTPHAVCLWKESYTPPKFSEKDLGNIIPTIFSKLGFILILNIKKKYKNTNCTHTF